jgi:branched-subunit amino acid transport protein
MDGAPRMIESSPYVWGITLILGLGTYLLRFSFLGAIGGRKLPRWALRMLRYTPVAVLPGLVAPMVLWPQATGGEPDPARLAAAAVTIIAGLVTRNIVASIAAGLVTLYAMLYFLG